MSKIRKRFHGIYWRQFGVNVALVALTLVLLGASFFALSYSYIMEAQRDELEDKARIMMVKAEGLVREQLRQEALLQQDPFSSASDYYDAWQSRNKNLEELLQVAQEMADIKFLIWLPGQGVIRTDDTMIDGTELTLPAEMGEQLALGETYAGFTTLGFYESVRFVVAVPSRTTVDGQTLAGPVLAIAEPTGMTEIWRAFLGIFTLTAVTVLLVAFMATASLQRETLMPAFMTADVTMRSESLPKHSTQWRTLCSVPNSSAVNS